MEKESVKQEQIVRKYFKEKYNLELTEKDYQEIHQSLYHLGKAIFLYSLQNRSSRE